MVGRVGVEDSRVAEPAAPGETVGQGSGALFYFARKIRKVIALLKVERFPGVQFSVGKLKVDAQTIAGGLAYKENLETRWSPSLRR
jgi:hypothetical protein